MILPELVADLWRIFNEPKDQKGRRGLAKDFGGDGRRGGVVGGEDAIGITKTGQKRENIRNRLWGMKLIGVRINRILGSKLPAERPYSHRHPASQLPSPLVLSKQYCGMMIYIIVWSLLVINGGLDLLLVGRCWARQLQIRMAWMTMIRLLTTEYCKNWQVPNCRWLFTWLKSNR